MANRRSPKMTLVQEASSIRRKALALVDIVRGDVSASEATVLRLAGDLAENVVRNTGRFRYRRR